MPAGLKIWNSDGYLQITDEFPSMMFITKGSVNLEGGEWNGGATNVFTGSHGQITVPNTSGYPPIIAIRCDTDIVLFRTRLIGSNWVYDIVGERSYSKTNTVYWYAFGPNSNPPSGENYGLEVRNSSSVLMFHSGLKPIISKGIVSSPGNYSIDTSLVAVCMLQNMWQWTSQQPGGTWIQNISSYSIKAQGNSATIKMLNFGEMRAGTNFGFGGGTSGQLVAMLVDVSSL